MKAISSENTTYAPIPSLERLPSPSIIFSVTAMKWMVAMVDIHPLEVGWYGIVDERSDGSYFVREIIYPKHDKMEAATCEVSPQGEADIIGMLIDENREEDIAKCKRLWGHSHHSMGTSPSGQDEMQALSIMRETDNYLIRVICNKRGDMSVSFFDNEKKIRFDNVKFKVENTDTEEQFLSILSKVSEVVGDQNRAKTSLEKIKEIKELVTKDAEMKQIEEWVKELKIENTPVEKTYEPPVDHYNINRGSKKNGNQTQPTLFDRDQIGGSLTKEDFLLENRFDRESGSFDNEQISDSMKEWEERIINGEY